MRGAGKNWAVVYCMTLTVVLVLWAFDYVSAPVRYRLGAGDSIDFATVTKTNQGAGSGLDADSVDGKHASDFIASGTSGIKDTDIDWGLSTGQVNTDDVPEGTANKYFNGKTLDDLPDGTTHKRFGLAIDSSEITDGTIANADVSSSAAIAESKLALNFATHSNANDPTASEKAALAGTNGTPSGTNKYVTNSDPRNTDARTPTAHKTSHETGGGDALTGNLDAVAKTTVRKNTGTDVGSRRRLNLIEGSNITITAADDAANEEVDVTIASSASSGGGVTQTDLDRVRTDLVKLGFRQMNGDNTAQFNLAYSRLDEFRDATGIDAGASSSYSARGTPNFDVIRSAGDVVDEGYGTGGTDDDAQHDTTVAYGSDVCTGGTASASTQANGYEASKAFDDNLGTGWSSGVNSLPSWIQYDLGSGVTKTVRKLRVQPGGDAIGLGIKDFILQGSNDGSSWTDIYTGLAADSDTWQDFTFSNGTAYRYYRIHITSTYRTSPVNAWLDEVEMMEIGTSGQNRIAQSFTPSANTTITKIDLYLLSSGSPDGNVNVRIETDATNKPSGTTVGTAASIAASSIGGTAAWYTFDIGDASVTASTKYWIVLYRSSETTGTVSWRYDGTSPTYTSGDDATSADGGTTWTVDTTHDALFKTYKPGTADGTVISTTATASAAPSSILVEWGETLNTGSITMYVSRDGGTTWTQASSPNSITGSDYNLKWQDVDVSAQPSGTSLKTKATISGNAELEAVGISW